MWIFQNVVWKPIRSLLISNWIIFDHWIKAPSGAFFGIENIKFCRGVECGNLLSTQAANLERKREGDARYRDE